MFLIGETRNTKSLKMQCVELHAKDEGMNSG